MVVAVSEMVSRNVVKVLYVIVGGFLLLFYSFLSWLFFAAIALICVSLTCSLLLFFL